MLMIQGTASSQMSFPTGVCVILRNFASCFASKLSIQSPSRRKARGFFNYILTPENRKGKSLFSRKGLILHKLVCS